MTPDLLPERFTAKIHVAESDCWLFTGAKSSNGYGSISHQGKVWSSHRLAYTLLIGPVEDGLTLDHLCTVKLCCNPLHLEPVSALENYRRWHAGITHCAKGHAFSEGNTYFHPSHNARECKTCRAERQRIARHAFKTLQATVLAIP